MRKILFITAVTAAILSAAYVGLIIRLKQELPNRVSVAFESLNNTANKSAIAFTYDNATFEIKHPFKVYAYLQGFKIRTLDESSAIFTTPEERLIIATSVLKPSIFSITLPKSLEVISNDIERKEYTVVFKEIPTLRIRLRDLREISGFYYDDQGLSVHNKTTNTAIAGIDKFFIDMGKEALTEEQERISLKMNVINLQNFDKAPDTKEDLDTIIRTGSSVIDVETIIAKTDNVEASFKELGLTIRQFDIINNLFSFTMKGNIKNKKDEMFPFGKLSLNIKNFEDLIKFQVSYINAMGRKAKQSGTLFPLKVDEEDVVRFMNFINRIAKLDPNDASVTLFDIVREEGSGANVTINNLSLPEILMIYQNVFIQSQEKSAPSEPSNELR